MTTDTQEYDVVAIGSATVDQFADSDSELIRIDTPTTQTKLIAFPLGSKILVKRLTLATGGGGTNCSVSLSRLGFRTAYLGKIGDDGNGDFVVRKLAEENVDFIGPREGQTGLSVILNSFAQDRTILAYKGANNDLRPEEIKPFRTRWIYLASMLETSFDTVVELISRNNWPVAFNPSNYQVEKGYKQLMPLLERVQILVMNLEEACKFLGKDSSVIPDPKALLREMAQLPPRVFAITDGGEGVHVYDREYYYRGHSTPNLKVLDTTGAGDAYASTFAAACMWGESTRNAINLAMTNAESILQHKGAKEILLTRDQLYAAAARNERTILQERLD